jgi:hypothetical protein
MSCVRSLSHRRDIGKSKRPQPAINGRNRPQVDPTPFLRSALHKLAQPLTAALWMNELRESRTVDPAGLNIGEELHRAAQMVHALRELLEELPGRRACRPVPIKELVESSVRERKLMHSNPLRLTAKPPGFSVSERLHCWADPDALDRTLNLAIEFLSCAAMPNGFLEVSLQLLGEQTVQIRLTVPAKDGESQAAEFAVQARPFEAKGLSFAGGELPKAARLQLLVQGMGGSIAAEGSPRRLALLVHLRVAKRRRKIVTTSVKRVKEELQ